MTNVRQANDPSRAGRQLEGGFLGLLILLVGVFVVAPLLDERTAGRVIVDILFFAAVVATIYVTVHDRRIVLLTLIAAAIAWAGIAAADIFDVSGVGFPSKIAAALLLALAPVTVFSHIVRGERVTLNTVYGAVCVYLLLVFFWAIVFSLIEDADPGSFAASYEIEDSVSDFLYFSMVTQTTLGYGDITPVTALSRSLSSLQAAIGQVFLVVTVARLVALQVVYSARGGGGEAYNEPALGHPTERNQPEGGES